MSLSCDRKCSTSNISHFTRVKWADDLNRMNAYIPHAIPFHCDDKGIKNERTKKYGEGCQAIHLITRTYAEMMTCRMAHGVCGGGRSPLLSKIEIVCSFDCFFFVHMAQ